MSGGKSSQFLFLVQNKKDLVSSCETATQAEKDIFCQALFTLAALKRDLRAGGKIRNFVRFLVNFGRGGEGGDGGGGK